MNANRAEKTIRAFIAIPLPGGLLEAIAKLQRQLEERLPAGSVRWVPSGQIHLTLRFLGNIPPAAVDPIRTALAGVAAGIPRFSLAAAGLGCFPSLHKPRVIWVGVTGQLDSLQQLQTAVERDTVAWGEHEARPFHPHLTLGRVKNLSVREVAVLKELLPALGRETLGRWEITEVCLMRSHLSPEGVRHEPLAACTVAVALERGLC